MGKLRLTLACGDYDRTRALAFGDVVPEGIDLNYLRLEPEEIFWRMARYREFDVSEISMSSYILRRSRGVDDFTAIPVFPSRQFRHSCIFINSEAGVARPEDLRGKRVGVPEYQLTAAVWVRGILQHDYGVAPHEIVWVRGGLEQPGRVEKQDLGLPPEIRFEDADKTETLAQMLKEGRIAALITPRAPSTYDGRRVRRLFPNFREVEKDYFRRTGIFPIMHTIAIRTEIVQANPWVPASLYKAFVQAKRIMERQIGEIVALTVSLPWVVAELEETKAVMGEDWWPYGLEANRTNLEALVQYMFEQGLTKRKVEVEELFAPSTLEGYKI